VELSYTRLTPEQIDAQLATVPGWSVVEGALTRTYPFGSYAAGVVFGNAVAHVADTLNHHPDLHIGYQRVTISMITHDAGGGLTSYDFELARRINALG
jgi:4a-hydroxytetrahydrobiopterin dehydratase